MLHASDNIAWRAPRHGARSRTEQRPWSSVENRKSSLLGPGGRGTRGGGAAEVDVLCPEDEEERELEEEVPARVVGAALREGRGPLGGREAAEGEGERRHGDRVEEVSREKDAARGEDDVAADEDDGEDGVEGAPAVVDAEVGHVGLEGRDGDKREERRVEARRAEPGRG